MLLFTYTHNTKPSIVTEHILHMTDEKFDYCPGVQQSRQLFIPL